MGEKFNKKEWASNDRKNNPERYREYNRKHEQTEKRKEYMKSEKKKEYYRERYLKKREEIREKQKEYYQQNKDMFTNTNKEYYLNNKETIIKHNSEYRKTRELNDYLYKLKNRIRSLIGNSMKRNGYKKNTKTHKILGCTFEEFKQHLENQFEPWMNWDNYGKYNGELNYGWDIDHKIPCSSALTEVELLQLNHYTNLKPLCSKINRDIKRGKV
jgi:hypothetical protein